MANEKRRQTNYRLSGGVNEKASKYTVGEAQVAGLKNMDFNIPNALNKRPGSTQMVTTGTSGAIRSIFEFQKLAGASFLFVGSNNELNIRNGTTGFSSVSSGWSNGQAEDYVAFVDRAWVANGDKMVSYNGTSLLPYGLPGASGYIVSSGMAAVGHTLPFNVLGWTCAGDLNAGQRAFLYMLVRGERSDAYQAPFDLPENEAVAGNGRITPISPFNYGVSPKVLQGITYGADYGSDVDLTVSVSFAAISGYGHDKLAIYLYLDRFSTVSNIQGSGINPATGNYNNDLDVSGFKYFTSVPAGESLITLSGLDNWTIIDGNTASYPAFSGMITNHFATYTPRYIEQGDNRMFTAGFSSAPSVVFFSEIGEPENQPPESFFEFRTDDGDRITGLKQYNDEVMIFKEKSFSVLLGDNADNYSLKEVTTEYGCLSNQAIVEYKDRLLFLDEKGIVEFNGASHNIISHPVEETFRRMNRAAAIDKARAVHLDYRNQVWFGIPVDGATENNLTVVYDYLLGAWTFFDGFNAASFHMARQELSHNHLWMGDYSGMVHYFSPSLYGDNGSGFSCQLNTKFDSPDGENIQSMFRRLFLDVNTVSGITGVIDVEVYKDYDRTAAATFQIFQNQFQTRKDFGVQGKSVAFQMTHNSPSLPLTLYGYTAQRRYLREV